MDKGGLAKSWKGVQLPGQTWPAGFRIIGNRLADIKPGRDDILTCSINLKYSKPPPAGAAKTLWAASAVMPVAWAASAATSLPATASLTIFSAFSHAARLGLFPGPGNQVNILNMIIKVRLQAADVAKTSFEASLASQP